MRISDWSSDVCSSDLRAAGKRLQFGVGVAVERATAQLAADMRDVDSGVIAVVLARAALAGDVGVDRARPAVDEEARVEAVERSARVQVQPRRGACVAFAVAVAALEREVCGASVGFALRGDLRLAVEPAPAPRAGERGAGQRRLETAPVYRPPA